MSTQVECMRTAAAEASAETVSGARKPPLRILHVVPRLGLGGTEQGVLKVLAGLGDQDFEHRICAVRGEEPGFVNRIGLKVKTYSVGNSAPGFQFPLFRLMGVMKEFRPHIVHTRNFGALEAILAARLSRVPVAIHSEHGYELEILQGLPLRRRILCRALFPAADAVFAVSEELRAYHSRQSWLGIKRFRVIHNGVSIEKFAPRPSNGARLRQELGIPADDLVIGSVGRLVPIKDHLTLLRAVESVLRQRKDLHVLLVGDGPERAKLEAHAEQSAELHGRVKFLGASDQIPGLMNAMDVFVLPSICEGMSNTVLEAMASGLPVVVTRSGGNPEMVGDGIAGLLFAPRDVEALAGHLGTLAQLPGLRQSLGEAARQRAVDLFSLSQMMRGYRDLYFDLAKKRNALRLA